MLGCFLVCLWGMSTGMAVLLITQGKSDVRGSYVTLETPPVCKLQTSYLIRE